MLTRFFLLAFLLCWAITIPIALQTQSFIPTVIPSGLQWLIGFAPLVAALIAIKGTGGYRGLRSDAFRVRVSPIWFVAILVAPWLILLASVAIRQIFAYGSGSR